MNGSLACTAIRALGMAKNKIARSDMPLKSGKSKKVFAENLKTELKHGKKKDQALAIAYSQKRKSKR